MEILECIKMIDELDIVLNQMAKFRIRTTYIMYMRLLSVDLYVTNVGFLLSLCTLCISLA